MVWYLYLSETPGSYSKTRTEIFLVYYTFIMSDNESKRDNLLQPFENKDIKRAVADTYHQHLLSLMNISTSCAVGIAHMPPGLVAQIAPAAFAIIVRSTIFF